MDTYHALLLLLLLLLALVSVSDASRPKESRFSWGKEEDFMWGAATAAYQVEGGAKEGGRGECIWDTFAQIPGKIAHGDNGDVAADSYHKYKEDVSLLKGMGLNSYRFSISWSRLIPTGRLKDGVNEVGIAYYNSLIDHLLANSIQPLVTLYHWDLPQVLHEDYGGWLDPRIERDFYDYANLCFTTFGDRVKFWATLNEPWTFAYMGYGVGAFAPGRCSDRRRCSEGDSETEPYLAAHNALNAHAVVVQLYRHSYQPMQNGRIGIVINHDYAWPLRGQGYSDDVAAAERHNVFQSAWFGDPITFGDYPALMRELVGSRLPVFTEEQKRRLKGSYDFLGLNHYSTKYYSPAPPSPHTDTEEGDSSSSSSRALFDSSGDSATAGWFADQSVVESPRDSAGSSAGPQAASPWLQVVPNGFKDAILWNTHRYTTQVDGTPLIIITENGCDVPGEGQGQGEWGSEPLAQVLHDEFRIAYYDGYLQALQQAREQGATVGGYFAWSLLDNFEWADGYSYRFGLTFVDYTSPSRTRIPKASSHWYRDYVKAHSASNGGFENYHGRRYRRSYGSSDNSDSGDNKGEGGGWWRFITSALEYHHGSMPTLADL